MFSKVFWNEDILKEEDRRTAVNSANLLGSYDCLYTLHATL